MNNSKIKEIYDKYNMLTEKLSDGSVSAGGEEWTKIAKEQSELSEPAEKYGEYLSEEKKLLQAEEAVKSETDPEMRELLNEEIYSCRKRLDEIEGELKILLLPKDKNDDRNCIMEIRGGAGGEEAALFAAELYRMYLYYCEKHRLKVEVVDENSTELGGIKEIVLNITGKDAYKQLKFESGVHRVQRVPETESQGRVHTSTVTVAVLPEAEEVDVEIRDEDVRVDVYRSSGAGGQKVNKTETAIRITHFPTGIVVTCQNERSQLQNKEMAFQYLRAKLIERQIADREAADAEIKGEIKKIEWGSQIRSYVFCPYTLVKDHRTGYENSNIQAVMDGDIQGFIIDYLKKTV